MLTIRLQRVGRKKEPLFRVVVTEHSYAAKSGKAHEVLGWYDPRFDKSEINSDRAKYWISKGAKPSDSIHNLLINKKVIEGKKINVLPKKTPPVKEVSKEEVVVSPKAEEAPAPEGEKESTEKTEEGEGK